eukprot:1554633-Amphidinium_carterae.1
MPGAPGATSRTGSNAKFDDVIHQIADTLKSAIEHVIMQQQVYVQALSNLNAHPPTNSPMQTYGSSRRLQKCH